MHELQRRAVEIGEIVDVVQPLERGRDDAQLHREGHAAALRPPEHARERLPFEVLHHDRRALPQLADFQRLHDVRMAQARGELRLVEEHAEEIGVERQLRLYGLENEELVEPDRTARDTKVDVCHPAFAQLGEDAMLLLRSIARLKPQS